MKKILFRANEGYSVEVSWAENVKISNNVLTRRTNLDKHATTIFLETKETRRWKPKYSNC